MTATTTTHVIGCDVGKAAIVVYDSLTGIQTSIANASEALAAWAAGLDPDCLVVCEATGGYEAALLAALVKAGVPAHRADARKVKAFIRSFGILGKTDAIDARALVRYGQERGAELPRWRPRDQTRARLQTMVLARRDLVAQRTAFNNRLKAPGSEAVQPYLKAIVDCLETQIRTLDRDLATLIDSDENLVKAEKILRGIGGVGVQSATALLALMPELGYCDRKKAASLAGLAPHPCQSGATDAYRRVKGGRPEIKRVLFMAALSAVRHDETMKTFYNRLIQNGKKPIVAFTAVMRKIIVIANARLRDGLNLKMSPSLS